MTDHRTLAAASVALAIALAGCGSPTPPPTAANACAAHGGVRPGSFEPEGIDSDHDGAIDERIGGEARCKDNVEIESDDAASITTGDWVADEPNDSE